MTKPRTKNPRDSYGIKKSGDQQLSARQAAYVAAVIRTGNKRLAKKEAGYNPDRSTQTIERSKPVQEALRAAKQQVMEKFKYGIEEAFQEAGDAIEFARETRNANAMVKAMELRAKLHGLIDKMTGPQLANFQIVIKGLDDTKPPSIVISQEEESRVLAHKDLSEEEEDEEAHKDNLLEEDEETHKDLSDNLLEEDEVDATQSIDIFGEDTGVVDDGNDIE